MTGHEDSINQEPLIPAAERLVEELQQTTDPEAKLLILSRAWGAVQAILEELQRRLDVDPSVSAEIERFQALALAFEAGSRDLGELLKHQLVEPESEN